MSLRSCFTVALSLWLASSAIACSDDSSSPGGGDPTGGNGSGAGGQATTGGSSSGGAASGGAASGGASSSGGAGGAGPNLCEVAPACDAALPDLGQERDWVHTLSAVTALGSVNHRGRDMFYNPGDAIWVMAKFAYGVTDDDIQDEDIDVYVERDCAGTWEALGTVRSTSDGDHATVEGVEDSGGWVYFDATNLNLGEGRHRFLFAVGGDLSTAETIVDIVPAGTPMIVTDVDGTLTTSENAEFGALLTGALPDANPDASAVIEGLHGKGYRVMYLTARPEFLGRRTKEFLDTRGFPRGLIHTSLTFTGATGGAAVTFKSDELAAIAARGLVPAWAFGNTDSDAEAYENAGVTPLEQRIMFQFTDASFGARRIQAYSQLLPEIGALPTAVCP